MNGKKARKLRQMLQCDLKSGSDDRAHGAIATDGKIIAQVHPDGSITEREVPIVEAKTTENRYLYRTCKKILNSNKNPEVKLQLRRDLTSKSEEADKE